MARRQPAPGRSRSGWRTSTSSVGASSGADSRTRATAWAIPPAAAMWFSLIKIASNSPTRWLLAPPAATAAFSSVLSPGVVLRVSSTTVPVPSTSRTKRAASVAIPDRRPRKLSAVRSPVSSAPAAAFDREHRPALLAPAALLRQALEAHVRIEQREARLGRVQAEDRARRLLLDQCSRTCIRRDGRTGRDVTSADVLGQGTPRQLGQLVAAHCMDEADLSR